MACEEIGYPYLDPNDGVHKYVGSTGVVACASLNVFANLPEVPILVWPDDDNGDGDGLTDFCRFYHVSGPVNATLTAPQFAGNDNEQEFRKWIIDGIDQPHGQRQVSLMVGDGDCHVAFAKYGFVVDDPDPDSTCKGIEFSSVCVLYGSVAYSLLPGADDSDVQFVQSHNACWNMSPGPGGQQLDIQPFPPGGGLQYLRMPDPDVFCHAVPECCPPSCPIVFFRPPPPPGPAGSPIWNTINSIRAHLKVGCGCNENEAAISLFNIGIGITGAAVTWMFPFPYCGPVGNTCGTMPVPFGCGPFVSEFVKSGQGGSCPASAQRLLNTPFVMSAVVDFNFGSGPPTVRKRTQLQANF